MDKTEGKKLSKEELEGFKKAVMESVALAEKATGNSEAIEFAKRLIKGFNRLFDHITALEGEIEELAYYKRRESELQTIVREMRTFLKEKDGEILALEEVVEQADKTWARMHEETISLKKKVEGLELGKKQILAYAEGHADESGRRQATLDRIREAAKPITDRIEETEKKAIGYGYEAGDISRHLAVDTDDLRALRQACTEGEPVPEFDKKVCPDCWGRKRVMNSFDTFEGTYVDCPTCKDGIGREVER